MTAQGSEHKLDIARTGRSGGVPVYVPGAAYPDPLALARAFGVETPLTTGGSWGAVLTSWGDAHRPPGSDGNLLHAVVFARHPGSSVSRMMAGTDGSVVLPDGTRLGRFQLGDAQVDGCGSGYRAKLTVTSSSAASRVIGGPVVFVQAPEWAGIRMESLTDFVERLPPLAAKLGSSPSSAVRTALERLGFPGALEGEGRWYDLDLDGLPELVARVPQGLAVFRLGLDGNLTPALELPGTLAAIVDLDGNGWAEVVTVTDSGTLNVRSFGPPGATGAVNARANICVPR